MLLSDKTLKKIRHSKAKKLLIQIPEGLKTRVLDIASELEAMGTEAIIYCEPCFGACDLRDNEARMLGCDLILHIGHSGMNLKTKTPVIYEEYRTDFNPLPILRRHLGRLKQYKNICLVTSLQYISALEKAGQFLEANGKRIYLKKPKSARYPGQVLGCDYSAALPLEKDVDCFLFICSGRFHALGLAVKTNKPVLLLDIETGRFESMENERERAERIRFARIEKAKSCKNFGILVSTKPGQLNLRQAERAKSMLEKKGKNAWILAFDEIKPEKIMGMKLECLVNFACPRIWEDSELFKITVLNPEDIKKI